MAVPVESEIKLRLTSPEAGREALLRLGAVLVRPRHFEDNVLLDDEISSLASGGRALRIRRAEGRAILTYKGPRLVLDGIRSREEVETEVPDPDALEVILLGLGFRRRFRYQKYRAVHAWRDVEIVLDETPLGTFLEVEGSRETIHEAARALGFAPCDYVTESYAALFFAAGGRGDMVFGDPA